MTILKEFLSPAILGVGSRNTSAHSNAFRMLHKAGYSRHHSTFFGKMSSPQTVPSITTRLIDWAKGKKPKLGDDDRFEIYNDAEMPEDLHMDVDKHMGTVRIQCFLEISG